MQFSGNFMTNKDLGDKLEIIRAYTVKTGELLHRARQIASNNPTLKEIAEKYIAGVRVRNMSFVAMFYGNGGEIKVDEVQVRADEYIRLGEEELGRLKA